MALSADTRPHFTTIANFISSMDGVIAPLFRDVLTVCYTEGLIGRRGKPVKSNITDNESAKLVSSHGVIQCYNGIATVDADHQIVVDAQAFGDVHEAAHVEEIIEAVEPVLDAEIDAYIADQQAHKAKTTDRKQVTKTDRGMRHNTKRAIHRMMEHFDSERGRYHYSRRMGVVEPVFGNTRATLGLERITLPGRRKVDAQWKLYCIVHNIGKLARYGPSFAVASG